MSKALNELASKRVSSQGWAKLDRSEKITRQKTPSSAGISDPKKKGNDCALGILKLEFQGKWPEKCPLKCRLDNG
jgi:hypothetical protein